MGCRLTRDEQILETSEMSDHKIDYKSRLEHKMCLAKETPEPNFDLSDCNLKEIPSGVFVLCRVLRKEILNLSKNKLTTFYGGALSDLILLQILDLSCNKLKQLPDDIFRLENLRELIISNNLLVKLPQTINSLKYLQLLDVSSNKLQSIDEINFMPRLRILNIDGNVNLHKIPNTLATCDNLFDLVLDTTSIQWPPSEIAMGGTESILKFLATGESCAVDTDTSGVAREAKPIANSREDALLRELRARETKQKQLENKTIYNEVSDGYGNENALLEQLQQRQMKQKQELLEALMIQQNETENLVQKIQQQRDLERIKLIEDIIKVEQSATIVIDQLLALKNESDTALLEKERIEEERLLEKLHLEHSDLRKQEVLSTMIELLKEEETKILDYQVQRNVSSRDILDREYETAEQLGNFFRIYEKNRGEIINKICEDEELQKRAVAALIEKNDARTWSLVEQLKIVETQLSSMTQLEIEKKKYSSEEQMNELAEKRLRLTYLLVDLLDQQESRKRQLLDTLMVMETQKANEQQDFWLLQYQRLIDSRPLEFSLKTNSIDPLLGYNFLVNGVIHCLPFLRKIWQNNDICLEKLSDQDLEEAGIRDEKDRRLILRSIDEFLKDSDGCDARVSLQATAPTLSPTISVDQDQASATVSLDQAQGSSIEGASECVICMEESVKIIFVPCGHMCCCLICQHKVESCPMCRATIERKIKVVQP